jgi:hypothetical protein
VDFQSAKQQAASRAPTQAIRLMAMFRRFSNSLFPERRSWQKQPHPKTTPDFFGAMNADPQRVAFRCRQARHLPPHPPWELAVSGCGKAKHRWAGDWFCGTLCIASDAGMEKIVRRFHSFAEAERADLEYWSQRTGEERLAALLDLIQPENPDEAVIERSVRVYPLARQGGS